MFLEDLNVTILSEEKFQFRQKKQFKLGSGGFGDVYRGTYDEQTVAVKCFAKPVRARAVSLLPTVIIDVPAVANLPVQTEPVTLRRSKTEKKGKTSISSLKHRLSTINVNPKVVFKSRPSKSLNDDVHTLSEPAITLENGAESGNKNISGENLSKSTSGSTSGKTQ